MYKNSNSRLEILKEIKIKRELMMKCANKYGFTNEVTVKYSQELDELINYYQRDMEYAAVPKEEVKITFKQMVMVWPKAFLEA